MRERRGLAQGAGHRVPVAAEWIRGDGRLEVIRTSGHLGGQAVQPDRDGNIDALGREDQIVQTTRAADGQALRGRPQRVDPDRPPPGCCAP